MAGTAEPGAALLDVVARQYQISPATLERIGVLVCMWAAFELDLEKALWRLSGETPYGKYPTTDTMQTTQRIARFRELAGKLDGDEWRDVSSGLADVAENVAVYRNAIVHGRLLPNRVGGGVVLNATWHGELRKRPSMIAHVDERLVGIMLDGLFELLMAAQEIAMGDEAPNMNPRILGRRAAVARARSGSGEVRHLTALMNSETY